MHMVSQLFHRAILITLSECKEQANELWNYDNITQSLSALKKSITCMKIHIIEENELIAIEAEQLATISKLKDQIEELETLHESLGKVDGDIIMNYFQVVNELVQSINTLLPNRSNHQKLFIDYLKHIMAAIEKMLDFNLTDSVQEYQQKIEESNQYYSAWYRKLKRILVKQIILRQIYAQFIIYHEQCIIELATGKNILPSCQFQLPYADYKQWVDQQDECDGFDEWEDENL